MVLQRFVRIGVRNKENTAVKLLRFLYKRNDMVLSRESGQMAQKADQRRSFAIYERDFRPVNGGKVRRGRGDLAAHMEFSPLHRVGLLKKEK